MPILSVFATLRKSHFFGFYVNGYLLPVESLPLKGKPLLQFFPLRGIIHLNVGGGATTPRYEGTVLLRDVQ